MGLRRIYLWKFLTIFSVFILKLEFMSKTTRNLAEIENVNIIIIYIIIMVCLNKCFVFGG